jgi:opacity protein-like surface antigen
MKRILSLAYAAAASLLLSSPAFATTCGPYLGAGIGKSWVKTPDSNIFIVPPPNNSSTHAQTGLGARGFVGFNVNKYLGIEGGYTRYARSTYNGSSPINSAFLKYYIHTYDVVAKAYLPIGYSGFNVYALAGYIRVVEIIRYTNTGLNANTKIALPNLGTTHGYNNRPMYGAGVNYNLGKHITINAEVTQAEHLNSFGTTPTAVPYLDLASVNVAYNFG